MHGWYSRKQESHFSKCNEYQIGEKADICIYSTPDGKEVEVTEVTQEKVYGSNFDDVVYVGEVVKWKRSRRPFGGLYCV